jgi:hypothetical protein
MRRSAPTLTCLLILAASPWAFARDPASPTQAQTARIVSFGPDTPYTIGEDPVQFVGVVRNDGPNPIEANGATVRLLALAGLDYTEGDTAPRLPALGPGESATFRWKLQPARSDTALVAGMALVTPGAPPVVRVSTVQQLARMPAFPDLPLSAAPAAWANDTRAWIQNDRIRLRIALSNSGVPMMWMAVWTGTAWRTTGVSLPMAEVLSAEGSQQPWWEVFRAETMRAAEEAKSARLIVVGGVGIRWRATVTIALTSGSSVAQIGLRLAPLRDMRLAGVRLATFLANANGNAPLQERCGAFWLAAIQCAGVTSGGLWPAEPGPANWTAEPIESIEGVAYRTFGIEARPADKPVALPSGSLMEFRARLFAISESETARDARRIAIGPPLKTPRWAKNRPGAHSVRAGKNKRHRREAHAKRPPTMRRRPGLHSKSSHRAAPKSPRRRKR